MSFNFSPLTSGQKIPFFPSCLVSCLKFMLSYLSSYCTTVTQTISYSVVSTNREPWLSMVELPLLYPRGHLNSYADQFMPFYQFWDSRKFLFKIPFWVAWYLFLWLSNEKRSTPRTGQPEGLQHSRKRNWSNCITLVSNAKQLSSDAVSTEDERRRKILGHSLILILKMLQSKRFPPTNLHLPSPQTLRPFLI